MIRALLTLLRLVALLAGAGGAAVVVGLFYFGRGLPDYRQLAVYEPR